MLYYINKKLRQNNKKIKRKEKYIDKSCKNLCVLLNSKIIHNRNTIIGPNKVHGLKNIINLTHFQHRRSTFRF